MQAYYLGCFGDGFTLAAPREMPYEYDSLFITIEYCYSICHQLNYSYAAGQY